MIFDLNKLIKALEMLEVDEDTDTDTDFEVGDRVLVHHISRDGTEIFISGEVVETLCKDDIGYYTRILGDNGNHYRTGLNMNEERLNTKVIKILD